MSDASKVVAEGARTKVSVVIPVWNPGEFIDPAIESLLVQTMPGGQFEVIFVDDGSTDGTGERLRAIADGHPHFRVVTIPNSGWPGKPRNVGTEAARGEYVFFMDQDDTLQPESLQRLYDSGASNGADIVLGKVTSDFRSVNHDIYRRSRTSCTIYDAPLIESLTPHKMFRRAFLEETGIRYPEGPRRLEDQLYMVKAYFAARSSAIVGNYVCYRYLRRGDGGNAGSKQFDPTGYYDNLREVLDVVDKHAEAGEERDVFYRRFLRVELLARLGGRKVLRHSPERFSALVTEVRELLNERFPLTVDAGMGAAMRIRSSVVRGGDEASIMALAHSYNDLKAIVTPIALRTTGNTMEIDVEVRLWHRRGPLRVVRDGSRLLLPRTLVGHACTDDARRVDDQIGLAHGDIIIKDRRRHDEWFLPGQLHPSIKGEELVWHGTAVCDPSVAAGGSPLAQGFHDFYVRVHFFGLTREKRLAAPRKRSLKTRELVAGAGPDSLRALPYATEHGNLSIDVGGDGRQFVGGRGPWKPVDRRGTIVRLGARVIRTLR